jgi:hypothetical protein
MCVCVCVCEIERERATSDQAHTQPCEQEDNLSGTPTGDGDGIEKIVHMKMKLHPRT